MWVREWQEWTLVHRRTHSCPVCIPASDPVTAETPSTPNLPLWYSFIHTENRLKYWNGTIIPVKQLIIILPCDYLWEQTPGPSADPDRFSPFVHVTLPGPVLHPGTWNPSALMSSCSIRYICAKLFIVGCWAAIVLFCSLHGAKSQFTGEPWTVCIDEWDLLLNRIASN